jgi:hypothetical protein
MLKHSAASYKAKVMPFFRCVTCGGHYHVVKLEAEPWAPECEAICACGVALPCREEKFVMKYFPLGNVRRIRKQKRLKPPQPALSPA